MTVLGGICVGFAVFLTATMMVSRVSDAPRMTALLATIASCLWLAYFCLREAACG